MAPDVYTDGLPKRGKAHGLRSMEGLAQEFRHDQYSAHAHQWASVCEAQREDQGSTEKHPAWPSGRRLHFRQEPGMDPT